MVGRSILDPRSYLELFSGVLDNHLLIFVTRELFVLLPFIPFPFVVLSDVTPTHKQSSMHPQVACECNLHLSEERPNTHM